MFARALPRLLGLCVCAGSFVWGINGSNALCPAGSSVITDAAQCQAAAAAAGLPWDQSGSWTTFPRGCFSYTDGTVALNTGATGAEKSGSAPLCAVPATGVLAQCDCEYT